jgi:hypothetical protein
MLENLHRVALWYSNHKNPRNQIFPQVTKCAPIKGAHVRDFRSLGLSLFLYHKASLGMATFGMEIEISNFIIWA